MPVQLACDLADSRVYPPAVDCTARLTTSPEMRAKLDEFGGEAYEVEDSYGCEYPAGHDGPHHSVAEGGSRDSDQERWIRWVDAGAWEIVELEPCDVDSPSDVEGGEALCLLPSGHPGPHTSGDAKW
jgi:hypothetical protein